MKINHMLLRRLTSLLMDHKLLSKDELLDVLQVAAENFSFEKQLAAATSVHFHVHVKDIDELPHDLLRMNGGKVENEAEGYIKYAFDGGINFIFSHIPIAHKERSTREQHYAYLDHVGIDIRSDEKAAYLVFQQIPLLSAQHDYLFTRQGDGKESVKCCHMQVKEKYWVYPNERLNYEFAFGPLVINAGGAFGVDLRPANPYNIIEETTTCCSEAKTKSSVFIHQ